MFDYLKVEIIWKEKNFNDDTAENTIPLYIIVPSFLRQNVAGFNYTHSASRCTPARSRAIQIDTKIYKKVVFIVNYCFILLIYEFESTFHSYFAIVIFIVNYFFTFKMLNIVSMTFTKKLLLITIDLLRQIIILHII